MFQIAEDLTKENIFKRLDSYTLFKYYCPAFNNVDTSFKSEFRTDKHPSARISQIGGDLLYKDFGEQGSYRVIDYIMRKYSLSFHSALEKINQDFNLGLGFGECNHVKEHKPTDIIHKSFREKERSIIKIRSREYEDYDLQYWNQFGISISTLKLFNIKAISHFWIDDTIYYADKLAYSYEFYRNKNRFMRKIYQPLSLVKKWVSNTDITVSQGECVLPSSGELLIITKSLKDVCALYELGYTAIAPVSESTFIPEPYLAKQKERFKQIIILLDNDETGVKRSIELSEMWNIPYILIPNETECKDISDFIKDYSKDEAIKLIKKLLNNVTPIPN